MSSVIENALESSGVSTFGWQQPVGYNAVSVNVLKPSSVEIGALKIAAASLSSGLPIATAIGEPAIVDYIERHLIPYDRSIQTGISGTEQAVSTIVAQCPEAKIVIAGYSQGAIAVHDAENALARNSPSQFSHIVATILLGDGDRVPSTKAVLFGTANRSSSGIRVYLHQVAPHDVPSPATTAEVANSGDVVADFSLRKDDSSEKWRSALSTHTSYVEDTQKGNLSCSDNPLGCAASWAASIVLKSVVPNQDPGSPTVAGAFQVPIGVTVSGNTTSDQAIQTNSSMNDAVPYYWQSAEYWLVNVAPETELTLTYEVNTDTGGPILQLMDPGTTDATVVETNGIDFLGANSGFNIGEPGVYQFTLSAGSYVLAVGIGVTHGSPGSYSFTFGNGSSSLPIAATSSA